MLSFSKQGQIKTGAPCRSERLAKYNQASDSYMVYCNIKPIFVALLSLSLSLSLSSMMAIVSSPTTARTGLLLCQVRIFPLPSLVGLICTMIRTTYHVFVKLTLHVIQFFVWLSRTSSLLCDTMNSHAYQI